MTGDSRFSTVRPDLIRINALLSIVKTAITGTYHAIRGQHAPRYLAEFRYRFNRRDDLKVMLSRSLTVAAWTPPMPHRLLRIADYFT